MEMMFRFEALYRYQKTAAKYLPSQASEKAFDQPSVRWNAFCMYYTKPE
jgi:hypothetical protein